MLSKCANPDCTKPFLYLCQGKLFRLEIEEADPLAQQDSNQDLKRIRRRTEFYWLCESCSQRMTVAYHKGEGVATILFPAHRTAS